MWWGDLYVEWNSPSAAALPDRADCRLSEMVIWRLESSACVVHWYGLNPYSSLGNGGLIRMTTCSNEPVTGNADGIVGQAGWVKVRGTHLRAGRLVCLHGSASLPRHIVGILQRGGGYLNALLRQVSHDCTYIVCVAHV
jgi:hypothetical protein